MKKIIWLSMILYLCGCATRKSENILPGVVMDDKQEKTKPSSEVNIEDWHFSFELPSEKWFFTQKQERKNTGRVVYSYKRKSIVDGKNRKVIPNIGIFFEKVLKDQDVILYSTSFITFLKQENGFKTEKIFIHTDGMINLKNAVGYVGKYNDPKDVEHTVVIVHAIREEIGVQIIMDVTTELFSIVENEFNHTLKTLRFTE